MKKGLSGYAMRVVRKLYKDAVDAEVNEVFHEHEGWKPCTLSDLDKLAARGAKRVQLRVHCNPGYTAPAVSSTLFPDYGIDELIRKPKLPEGMRLAYPSFGALKLAIQIEYGEANRQARTYSWKFIRPRHRQMMACCKGERCHRFDEAIDWNGTLADLVDFAKDAAKHGADEVYIEGGFDGSDYFNFDPYEPTEEFYGVTAIRIDPIEVRQAEDRFCPNETDQAAVKEEARG